MAVRRGGAGALRGRDAVSLRINTNIEAFNAHRQLERTQLDLGKSIEKLSSGLRINRAADDAAGLAISEKLRGQIRGIAQASRNAQDGIALVQTAEGALNEVHAILQRVRELAVAVRQRHALAGRPRRDHGGGRAALGRGVPDRDSTTTFNQIALLGGNATITFQVGANSGRDDHDVDDPGVRRVAGAAINPAIFQFGHQRRHRRDRPGAVVGRRRPRRSRRDPEPARAHGQQPGRLQREPVRRPSRASATSTWRPR